MSNARANAINTQLYRNLKSGKKYEVLMPYSDCSSVKLAEGDTKVAIDNMAYWSKKYQHHTKKLAETFRKKGLQEICTSLHSFLYHHFQYKIDGRKQNLRSPACSWSSRKSGIDCKSFSIIASTCLLNLGIKHYLRRIRQSPNDGYSHVYVIVPKNQNQPDNLNDGYYTIDGTLSSVSEPLFYQKDDVYMESELPIYGLAGLNVPVPVPANPLQDSLLKGAAQLVDLAFQGLFNELMGCDDAEYEFPVLKLRVERDLKTVLQKKITDLEAAIQWSNRSRIQYLFNDIFKEVDLGIAHLRSETAYSQRDECIAQILSVTLKYVEKLKKVLDTFYNNFKKSFTRYKVEEFTKTTTTSNRTLYFVVEQSSNPINAEYRYIVLRKEENKYGIEPILPFGDTHETFDGTAGKWLAQNVRHLKNTYKDGRELLYKSEIEPLIKKVGKLRKEVHLGGENLYLFEQPIQRKMYIIWLEHDNNYTNYLKEETQSYKTANELAMRDYQERFTKEIEKDLEVKKRKALKKKMGIGALAFVGFLVVKNK